jgi:hypothetical protein
VARRLSQDMKASEDQARLLRPHHRVLHVPNLRSLLPDRQTVDILLQKYFDTFETTLRIVHRPTFNAAYKTYWDVERATNSELDAMILAILACTACTSTHTSPRYNHSGSTFHSKAVVWIRALDVWLKRQSNKRRSLATLQVLPGGASSCSHYALRGHAQRSKHLRHTLYIIRRRDATTPVGNNDGARGTSLN